MVEMMIAESASNKNIIMLIKLAHSLLASYLVPAAILSVVDTSISWDKMAVPLLDPFDH